MVHARVEVYTCTGWVGEEVGVGVIVGVGVTQPVVVPVTVVESVVPVAFTERTIYEYEVLQVRPESE